MHASPPSDLAPPPLTLFQGDRERACQLYESLLKEEQTKDDTSSKSTLPFLAMQYANFLRVCYKDVAKGRKGRCGCDTLLWCR